MINDVPAKNQVKTRYFTEGDIENSSDRILFIGNSIVYHEAKPEIFWYKNCGMAASDLEHDFVHLVYKELKLRNPNCSMLVTNGSAWEQDYINLEKLDDVISMSKLYKFKRIVLRLGDNFNKELVKDNDPFIYFDKLIKGLKNECEQLIATSCFWLNPKVDEGIKKAALNNNVDYIDITDLGDDDKYMAKGLYEHFGVSIHPGDLGMQEIANRIIEVIDK